MNAETAEQPGGLTGSIRRLLVWLTILLVAQVVGCGLQFYLIHKNHILKHQIDDGLRELRDAEQRVKGETERLQQLLKGPPPQLEHHSEL